jgi:hypothetical protein
MVGLYAIVSYVVLQRRQEIGVRVALGATRAAAVWLIARDALFLIGAGITIALPAAWTLRRLVEAQLYGVSAFDVPTITFASGLLVATALAASLRPHGGRHPSIPPRCCGWTERSAFMRASRRTHSPEDRAARHTRPSRIIPRVPRRRRQTTGSLIW